VVSFVLLETLPFLATAPGVLLYAHWAQRYGAWWALLGSFPAGALFVVCTCFLIAAGKRLAMPHAREGVFVLRSWFGLRKWVADKLMQYSLEATNPLYATLYAVGFLRLLGAKVGRRAEVSTVSNVDPDLLNIGSESFIADIATVGPAAYDKGWVALGRTHIGHRSFVGNAATIPGRTTLGDDCLIGVQSVPASHNVPAGTSWLGTPAIFLPRRQASQKFDEAKTFTPPASVVAGRLAIEFVRIVLPPALMYVMFFSDVAALVSLNAIFDPLWLMIVLPLVFLGTGVGVVVVVALLKWMLVGRYHPRVEPQWAYFVRRTDLVTGLYESAAVPAMLDWASGTPFLPAMLRWFGSKMGRRVFLETTYLTEFDLVDVADDAQVGMQTSLQTHLFEDRVMKMSRVEIGAGATVGPRSVVLYDSSVEAGAHLDALSLVMKGENLPAQGRWRGVPARPVGETA
jgi:non-ribosomal peptide synthetase-like protein